MKEEDIQHIKNTLKTIGRGFASHVALETGNNAPFKQWDALDEEEKIEAHSKAEEVKILAQSRMEAAKLAHQHNKDDRNFSLEERKLDEHSRHNKAMEDKEKPDKYGINPETGKPFTPIEWEEFKEERARKKREEEMDNREYMADKKSYDSSYVFTKPFKKKPERPDHTNRESKLSHVSDEEIMKALRS